MYSVTWHMEAGSCASNIWLPVPARSAPTQVRYLRNTLPNSITDAKTIWYSTLYEHAISDSARIQRTAKERITRQHRLVVLGSNKLQPEWISKQQLRNEQWRHLCHRRDQDLHYIARTAKALSRWCNGRSANTKVVLKVRLETIGAWIKLFLTNIF